MSSKFRVNREIPSELVVEILSRVPVKDLIRFRCVCKTWRSLFQDERFIQQHMNHAQRRIISLRKSPLCHFVYESGKSYTTLQEVDLNIGDKTLPPKSRIVGHCRGLFCLYFPEGSFFSIWNPSLRELRKIEIRLIDNFAEMGFGYDHLTQDYKIVLVPDMESGSCSKAQVLSLKASVTRMIDFPCLDNFEMCHLRGAAGTLLGQNIYWRVYDYDLDTHETILSFDLVSETFKYCPGPNRGQPIPQRLDVLGEGLCTLGIERCNLGVELVMWSAKHDNGVIISWSKTLRLPWGIVESSITHPRVHNARPESVIIYAGLLLFLVGIENDTKLFAYNFEEKSLTSVETSLSFNRGVCLATYVETLVPIPIPAGSS